MFAQPTRLLLMFLAAGFLSLNSESLLTQSDQQIQRMKELQEKVKESVGNQLLLNQIIGIAQNPELMDELDIVGDQREELHSVMQTYLEENHENHLADAKTLQRMKELQEAGDTKGRQKLGVEMQEQQIDWVNSFMKKVDAVMLPHQMKRMKQIYRQQTADRQSPYAGFLGLPLAMAKKLGLSDSESKRLKDATEKADKEFRAKVEELRTKLMKDVINAMPENSREKFRELVGKRYDPQEAQRRMRVRVNDQLNKKTSSFPRDN